MIKFFVQEFGDEKPLEKARRVMKISSQSHGGEETCASNGPLGKEGRDLSCQFKEKLK